MCETVFVRPSTIQMSDRMQKKLEELMSKEEFKQLIREINKETIKMNIEILEDSQAKKLLLDNFEEIMNDKIKENLLNKCQDINQ